MKKALFYIAAGAWVTSLVVHLVALGGVDLQDVGPIAPVLYGGLIVVGIPALILRKSKPSALSETPRRFSLLAEFRHAPRAVGVLAAAGFVYALLIFGLLMIDHPGTPQVKDGEYVLVSRNGDIRTLNEAEYHQARAWELWGLSGNWIALYGVFAAGLYPSRKEEEAPSTPPNA